MSGSASGEAEPPTVAVDRLVSRAAGAQLAGRADEAIAILAEALRLDPNHASALTFGCAPRPAPRAARTRHSTTPSARSPPIRAGRAHTICEGSRSRPSGRGAEALIDLRQAVALDRQADRCPAGSRQCVAGRGRHRRRGRLRSRPCWAPSPVRRSPTTAWAICAARQQQFDAAIAAYSKAIELDPRLSQAHGNLGMLQFGIGENDAAIAAFRRAVALAPDRPANWSALLFALSVSDRATARRHRCRASRFRRALCRANRAVARRSHRRRALAGA